MQAEKVSPLTQTPLFSIQDVRKALNIAVRVKGTYANPNITLNYMCGVLLRWGRDRQTPLD